MIVKDLIEKKDYDYISWRVTLPEKSGGGDTFFGCAKSENGKLIPLDHDIYYGDEVVLRYEVWPKLEYGVKNGLTVVVECDWM